MSPTIAARRPAAVDYERTLILSIEVSNQSWVLAAQVRRFANGKALGSYAGLTSSPYSSGG
jgi:transposase